MSPQHLWTTLRYPQIQAKPLDKPMSPNIPPSGRGSPRSRFLFVESTAVSGGPCGLADTWTDTDMTGWSTRIPAKNRDQHLGMENPRDTLDVNLEVVVALATVVIANVTTVAITLIQQSATRRQLQAQSDAEAARWMGGDRSRAREREEDRDHQRQLDRLAAQRALVARV